MIWALITRDLRRGFTGAAWLPIAFFLLLATTSHRELGPVYRSPAGVAMVASGLVMQALAYLWITKLMRVEV